MNTNPLKKLETLDQAIWIDYIKRDMFQTGQLKKFIADDGVRGMTSNPSIFENAIAKSHDYDEDIKKMSQQGKDVNTIFESLTQKDVQDAADEFRPLYEELKGQDGYVSLEVNPHLAHDTQGTIEEGRRLWKALNRPNVFIKVPATKEGLLAIEQLISEGINVNVTLLFSLERYRDVAYAYIAGIESRKAQGKPVENIRSVASFFLSRIDALLDPKLEKISAENSEKSAIAKQLQGQVAIGSAKMAYQIYKELFENPAFKKLGANVQRLLWASTSTKNPAYSDVKYVEALIGPQTVNTLPLETLEAYRDHGDPKLRLEDDTEKFSKILHELPNLGIDLSQVTQALEDEGVDKFIKSYDQLIKTLEQSIAHNKDKS